jgi:hypothetical protein
MTETIAFTTVGIAWTQPATMALHGYTLRLAVALKLKCMLLSLV